MKNLRYLFTLALLVITLAMGLAYWSVESSATSPSNSVLTVYSEPDYTGDALSLAIGEYDLQDLQRMGMKNDSIASVKIKNGFTAIMYEHHFFNSKPGDKDGYIKTINENVPKLDPKNYKNISSIKVYSSKDCPTPTPTITPTATPTPITPTLPPTGGGGTDNFRIFSMSIILLFGLFICFEIVCVFSEKFFKKK